MKIYMQNLYNSFVNFCYSIFGQSEKIHRSDVDEQTRLKEEEEHLEDGTLSNYNEQNKELLQEQQRKLEEERFLLDQKMERDEE